jgi:hypothetical protein
MGWFGYIPFAFRYPVEGINNFHFQSGMLLKKHYSKYKKEEPRPEKKMRLSFDRIRALLVNAIIYQHSNLR